MTSLPSAPAAVARAFRGALDSFGPAPPLVMSHNDADGLSAAAILARAFAAAGRPATIRILGRGETPWSDPVRQEVAATRPGGLVVADLGTRASPIAPGIPTVILDHHLPAGRPDDGTPDDAAVITGLAFEPVPTTSLLAYWAASALGPTDDLLWLAAIGLIGDMAEGAGFPELDAARARYGITALRDAAALVNAPRRSASGDAGPALALLLAGSGPKDVTRGDGPDHLALRAAREEVRAASEAGRKVAPKIRRGPAGESLALIRFDTPCQVHPLLAQSWRGRLKGVIVLAANAGYRPGWVHFAARGPRGVNLVDFLAGHRPSGADEAYGSGHAAASGGALRPADWNRFVTGLGFGPEECVPDA